MILQKLRWEKKSQATPIIFYIKWSFHEFFPLNFPKIFVVCFTTPPFPNIFFYFRLGIFVTPLSYKKIFFPTKNVHMTKEQSVYMYILWENVWFLIQTKSHPVLIYILQIFEELQQSIVNLFKLARNLRVLQLTQFYYNIRPAKFYSISTTLQKWKQIICREAWKIGWFWPVTESTLAL